MRRAADFRRKEGTCQGKMGALRKGPGDGLRLGFFPHLGLRHKILQEAASPGRGLSALTDANYTARGGAATTCTFRKKSEGCR